jgi:catechol 2,3-dioxygenase-like lactoylglutathione lyase family enzyme
MEGVRWGIITIAVSDMDEMVDFYTKTLGFRLVTKDEDWAEIDTPGIYIGMHLKEKGTKYGKGNPTLSFGVKSLKDNMSALGKKGVRFGKVEEDEIMWITTFNDPEGNRLSLVEKKRQ